MDRDLLTALKTLTDAVRLRLLGRLAAGPATTRELADDLAVPLASVVRQVGLLRRVGLVRPVGARGERLELALDRLQRYRKAAGLSPVVALLADHEPESGSWNDDAERWWKTLADALHTRA